MRQFIRFMTAILICAISGAALYLIMPPYTLNPFCTYDLIEQVQVTIDVDGTKYSSEIVHQNSFSRKWIEVMNGSGCSQTLGTVLAYVLADGKVLLLPPPICAEIEKQLKKKGLHDYKEAMAHEYKASISQKCVQGAMLRDSRIPDGYVVDNVTNPSKWEPFFFDVKTARFGVLVRFVSGEVQATTREPRDNLEQVAPALLKTQFEDAGKWYASPERYISYARRYPFTHFARKVVP